MVPKLKEWDSINVWYPCIERVLKLQFQFSLYCSRQVLLRWGRCKRVRMYMWYEGSGQQRREEALRAFLWKEGELIREM